MLNVSILRANFSNTFPLPNVWATATAPCFSKLDPMGGGLVGTPISNWKSDSLWPGWGPGSGKPCPEATLGPRRDEGAIQRVAGDERVYQG